MEPSIKNHTHREAIDAAALHDELSSNLVRRSSALFELGKYAITLGIVITLVHSLLFTIKIISGPSMVPNFTDRSVVLLDRRQLDKLKPSDVVILKYPGDPDHHEYIKRIVAGPTDRVAIHDQRVYVNDRPLAEPYLQSRTVTEPAVAERTLGESEYYTLGDNRPVSNDSRFFGPVERRYIVGRVFTTLFRPK